jgi:hypothetical protein
MGVLAHLGDTVMRPGALVAVAASLGHAGSVTPEGVAAAVRAAGVTLPRCLGYHVGKAVGLAPLVAPRVLCRGPHGVDVEVQGYSEVEEVGGGVEVEVDGMLSRVAGLAPGKFGCGRPTARYHIKDLVAGQVVVVRCRGVSVGAASIAAAAGAPADGLHGAVELALELPWSASLTVRSQVPVGQPSAPVVESATPSTVKLQLHNPGVTADPVGVGLVIEVNGVSGHVVQLDESQQGAPVVVHEVVGLREGCDFRVRHKVMVGDPDLDAAAPWSLPTTVRTPTRFEVRLEALERREASLGRNVLSNVL